MACYHPVSGWYAQKVNESGKRSIVFNLRDGFKDKPVELPCGRCIGCKLERSRQWAVRCMHEASLYEANSFVTLTYEDEKLPPDGGLRPRDYVLFMKRLRKAKGNGIRFFHCGEYGTKFNRPHHHALLFNVDFSDKRVCRKSGSGEDLYSSGELESLWGYGKCWIGRVTFESAGYVARYTLKKVNGPNAADWYMGRHPEYLTMSRKPGIGTGWIKKWFPDVYRDDSVIVNGVECKPPKFYDEWYRQYMPREFNSLVRARVERALNDPDNNQSRRNVKEEVKLAAIKFLSREIEL